MSTSFFKWYKNSKGEIFAFSGYEFPPPHEQWTLIDILEKANHMTDTGTFLQIENEKLRAVLKQTIEHFDNHTAPYDWDVEPDCIKEARALLEWIKS